MIDRSIDRSIDRQTDRHTFRCIVIKRGMQKLKKVLDLPAFLASLSATLLHLYFKLGLTNYLQILKINQFLCFVLYLLSKIIFIYFTPLNFNCIVKFGLMVNTSGNIFWSCKEIYSVLHFLGFIHICSYLTTLYTTIAL